MLNNWKIILREGQFHIIYLICYSDIIIKWPLGLLADTILYNSEVIQYLHKAVNIVAKISATPLKT